MSLQTHELVDIAVSENIPPSNYFTLWNELGDWQLDILKTLGLSSDSRIIDVGCGPLRLGCRAIPFLNENCYYGIDAVEELLNIGKKVLRKEGITKTCSLLLNDCFELDKFQASFDFGIAASVFTYSGRDKIEQCIKSLKQTMKPSSVFLFTFILQGEGIPIGTLMDGRWPMRFPALEDTSFFVHLAEQYKINFKILHDIEHPTGQIVAIFEF